MTETFIQGVALGVVIGIVVCGLVVFIFVNYAVQKTAEDEIKADDLDGPKTPNDI